MSKETIITMREGNRLPVNVSADTLYRWVQKGVVNRHTGSIVFLETIPFGGRIYTSIEAVERFNQKLVREDR